MSGDSASATAVFVAVAVDGTVDDAELSLSERHERRSLASRLHDEAWSSVIDSGDVILVTSVAAVLAVAAVSWADGHGAMVIWASLALVAALAGRVTRRAAMRLRSGRRPARPRDAALLLCAAALWILLASAPWLVGDGHFVPLGPMTVMSLTTVALVCVWGCAPLPAVAAWAVALALAPALAASFGGTRTAAALQFAAAFAVLATAIVGVVRHRAWVRAATATLELRDTLAAAHAGRDAAIKADQEKSRFLAIASHDLRQPVHAIGLFAATLDKRLQGSSEEPLIRNMIRAIDGLDRSFNAMLDISRLDAGTIEPQPRHFPLRDLFRRLHMHFAGQAEQKGLGLRFSPGGKAVSSDPQLLERVLGNLVQNAMKYTEHGGIVVVARSTPTHVHIEVWDTGIGIRPADLPKVFDEFYQVGSGHRVRAQGLGMGLAIVKRLVRLLGHELIVASQPGRGTMFRLRIALGGLPQIQDVTAAADTLPMSLLEPRTVLVLDDEEAIRDGLCMLLEEWGYDAIGAASVAEAASAVARLDLPPDLILSDLHLGDGPDGIAGIAALRRQFGCDIPAMLITGDTSAAEVRRATASGYQVLWKPVQPRKLYNALRGLGG